MADFEFCFRDRDLDDSIVAWIGNLTDVEIGRFLKDHPSWYMSTAVVQMDLLDKILVLG